ncbi:hypothetical protein [Agrobacterium sp. 22-223-1]
MDYFQEVAVASGAAITSIWVTNAVLMEEIEAKLRFSPAALPNFGVWRAFQSGAYAIALEPMRRRDVIEGLGALSPGLVPSYWLELQLLSIDRI